MKIKKELYLRKIGDEYILVPIGKTVDEFNGLFNLTESGAIIFEAIQNGEEKDGIVKKLTDEFEIDEITASRDVDSFIEMLIKFDIV